jgi:hypothetical protein
MVTPKPGGGRLKSGVDQAKGLPNEINELRRKLEQDSSYNGGRMIA